MTNYYEIAAAVEMSNEGLGGEALAAVFHGNYIQAIEGGFRLMTPEGMVTVQNSGNGLTVEVER